MNFVAAVQVARLTDREGGPVTGYAADIGICCADCGQPFRFRHGAYGASPDEATVSVDNTEMRAPIEPAYVAKILGKPIRGDA